MLVNLMGDTSTHVLQTRYELTFADYKRAQWLYLKKRPWSMLVFVFSYWCIPGFALMVVCLGVIMWARGSVASAESLLHNFIPFFILAALGPLFRMWKRRRAYSDLFPKGVSSLVTLAWDDEQLVSAIPGRVEGRYFWRALQGLAEDSHVGIIFIRRKMFLVVPKTALPEQGWEELRRRIASAPKA